MRVVRFISLLFIICLFSCTGKKDNSIITFQLSKSDYIEKINVAGTVQAVVNTPVMPPRNQMGQMTIVRLVQDGAFVKQGDTLCVLSSPEVESRYREMLTSIETLEAELKKAEADIRLNTALLEAQLATSEAQLKISSLDSLQMKFATEVNQKLLELEMKRALIEKQKTERKLAATKTIGATDIRQKRARIMQEKMRAQTFADQISAMTGYSPDELIGKNSRMLYPTDEDYEYVGTVKYALMREHGIGTVETRWRRKDGTIRDILLSSTPIDLSDIRSGIMFTALDITD